MASASAADRVRRGRDLPAAGARARSRGSSSRALLALALVALGGGRAAADGAFPDSNALYLPADRPHEIVLATNFGLVTSEDDGATWHLVCEQAVASNVLGYQLSAPPDDTLYAETSQGVARSSDNGCSWSFASGALAGANVIDIFPDAVDPLELFAISRTVTDAGVSDDAVYHSTDGGRTFADTPLFAASSAQSLTGVEKARSGPRTVYLTLFSYPPLQPILGRSNAMGGFDLLDQSTSIASQPYLAAVDPIDANILYLRLRGQGDSIGISRDAGATISTIVPMAGRMSAFLRRSNGTILVGSSDRTSLRSTDGGATFTTWTGAPHVRALAERGGLLYAAADNARDGYALATSSDEGLNWTPILHFRDIKGPLPCGNLPDVCAAPWAALYEIFAPPDAGVAPVDAAMPDMAPVSVPASPHHGCGCDVGARPAPASSIPVSIVLVVAWLVARRGRASRSHEP